MVNEWTRNLIRQGEGGGERGVPSPVSESRPGAPGHRGGRGRTGAWGGLMGNSNIPSSV